MHTSELEKKNSRKGWVISITIHCVFLILAGIGIFSCHEEVLPKSIPGEVLIEMGEDEVGSGEILNSSLPQDETEGEPQHQTEPIEQTQNEQITDPDSDLAPEDVVDADEPIQNQVDEQKPDEPIEEKPDEAEDTNKEDGGQLTPEQLAEIEKARKDSIRKAKLALISGRGNSDQSGTAGDGGVDESTNTGTGGTAYGEEGSPTGWKKSNDLPDVLDIHVAGERQAVATIAYIINSDGDVQSITSFSCPEVTDPDDIQLIKDEFMKLKFKPIDPDNVKLGQTAKGVITWKLTKKE